MTKNLMRFTALVIVALMVNACSKDAPVKTRADFLMQGPWKLSQLKFTGVTQPDTTRFPLCLTDNILTFGEKNLYTEEEGLTKCDSFAAPISYGVWGLKYNEGSLVIVGGTYTGERVIDNVDDNFLILKESYQTDTSAVTIQYTFKH